MSYTRLPYGSSSYGFAEFVADSVADDLAHLPTDSKPGSKAIFTDDNVEYILNNKHQWVPYSMGGTGSGGEGMTQAQINAAVDNALANKDFVTHSELNNLPTGNVDLSEITAQIETQADINTAQQQQIDALEDAIPSFNGTQAGQILVVNNEGEIEARTISDITVNTTTSGLNTFEVSNYTGRSEDNAYLYECTAQQWNSFSVRDGENMQFVWNRLKYEVYVTASGDDFILGDPNGSDPYVIFTHRQDLGVNKLIAKVYQPTPSQIKDTTFKVITGVPQQTDNLVLRANGHNYRLYIDTNGSLQVAMMS